MGIRAELEGNTINIDGGKVFIERDGAGKYHVKALDFHTVTTSNRATTPQPAATKPELDPHFYSNGHNHLTLAGSVARAMTQVYDILEKYDVDAENSEKIREVVERMIIANKGRDKVYSLVGRIAKDIDAGVYKGVPFSVLFDALESGEMNFPKKNPYGEVKLYSRYGNKVTSYPPYPYRPFGR